MSIPVPVNIAVNFSTGMLTHNAIPPPPSPPSMVTGLPSMEMVATQMWTFGYLSGKNKLTQKVLHKNLPIVQMGHDCGRMIPDITPPMPTNLWYPAMWMFSSRKIVFPASTVQMEDKPTGCAFAQMLPMMTCGEPMSAPTAFVHPTQLLNNVYVGMTLSDFLQGLSRIAVEMAIDIILDKVVEIPGYDDILKRVDDDILKKIDHELAEKASKKVDDVLKKMDGPGYEAMESVMDKAGLTPEGYTHKTLDSVCQSGVDSMFGENATQETGTDAPTANEDVGFSKKEGYTPENSSPNVQGDTGAENFGEPLP